MLLRTAFSFVLFAACLASGPALAQQSDEKAYARVPKEIAFQNDSQWEDNRWQQTEIGPFLAGTLSVNRQLVFKGLAIRIGEDRQATVCYDTARMSLAAGWTGGFLKFEPRRFGLIRPPQSDGQPFLTTRQLAGWSHDGRFVPTDAEMSVSGRMESRLPSDWAHFRGHYASGNRIVLSYTVGSTEVLESPWFVEAEGISALVRHFEIGPTESPLQLLVSDAKHPALVDGETDLSVGKADRRNVLRLAPDHRTRRFKVLIGAEGRSTAELQRLADSSSAAEDLSALIANDQGRFTETLTTEGTTTETGGPYVIDTVTLPFENPWKALFFTAGHDFYSDGRAAVATVHGDVWTVEGIDRDLKELRWRRFATGLCQPLGLRIVGDQVYVIGRNQITRLHDRNDDGEADFYENFNNDLLIGPGAHDYVTCLDTDDEDNFYFIHAKTGVMKVSADGSKMSVVADGFRNPNGMGVGPGGMITAAPQQGAWTPESSLIVVEPGGYYGYGGPRVTDDRPTGWDLPMCFIPRAMDNSGGAQVWVRGDRWGLPEGQMLHLSYGQCRLLLALPESVGGRYQGGTVRFPTTPADFESGIMRGRFSPRDGQLYVSGLRGWQTRAIRDGCFQRLRYTGGSLHLPLSVKTFQNGIQLTFNEPLDGKFAENPDHYFVEQWNYLWSKAYGSPDLKVSNPEEQGRDEVPVVSATLLDDQRSVFLEMPNRHPVNQIAISWLLRESGQETEQFRGTFAHTINVAPEEVFPESRITRVARPRLVPADVEARLTRGLHVHFRTDSDFDSQVARMVAVDINVDEAATPFLSPGPFTLLAVGTIKTPLSGFYEFRIEGGPAQLQINEQAAVDTNRSAESAEPLLLQKGHNVLQLAYRSPDSGNARLKLWWRGHGFDWEPVPARVLHHDPTDLDLVRATQRRRGRTLVADLKCVRCHELTSAPKMFELTLSAPDLTESGKRWNPAWIRKWVLDPQSLRPGTSMPNVLHQRRMAEADAADLAAYLAEDPLDTTQATSGNAREGEALYETLGCISCHHFAAPADSDDFDRLSLFYAGAKYRQGALAKFLLQPGAHHAATRMPAFRLSEKEASSLAAFVRRSSKGSINEEAVQGDPERGKVLFAEVGCAQCHTADQATPATTRRIVVNDVSRGCLADAPTAQSPGYALTPEDRALIRKTVAEDLASLSRSVSVEASHRLFHRLQCGNCHNRDGERSHRQLVVAEEGSGSLAEVLPELTWSGEKLRQGWTHAMLAGDIPYKSRPWLKARMPAFPAYAEALAEGLAAEHAAGDEPSNQPNPELSKAGEQLTLQTGLDCRQCHAIGDLQPRGDEKTQIAHGINFAFIKERMRKDFYDRFMLNPPRYDPGTKMIRLSLDGKTTKLKNFFDSDARQQFDALWHYLRSVK